MRGARVSLTDDQLCEIGHIRCRRDATQRTERSGVRRKMYLLTGIWKAAMSDSNVIPFRRREPKPSMTEIEMYRRMTRNWSDQMRQLMFPDLFELDSKSGESKGS
jgi:hypothetical protein